MEQNEEAAPILPTNADRETLQPTTRRGGKRGGKGRNPIKFAAMQDRAVRNAERHITTSGDGLVDIDGAYKEGGGEP